MFAIHNTVLINCFVWFSVPTAHTPSSYSCSPYVSAYTITNREERLAETDHVMPINMPSMRDNDFSFVSQHLTVTTPVPALFRASSHSCSLSMLHARPRQQLSMQCDKLRLLSVRSDPALPAATATFCSGCLVDLAGSWCDLRATLALACRYFILQRHLVTV